MTTLHIGTLVFDYQAIDIIGPCDLLNSATKRLMNVINYYTPVNQETVSKAPEIIFHHIGETLDPVTLLTSSVTVVPTVTVDNVPPLDILIVGGDSPAYPNLPPKLQELIRRHVASGKLLFTTCTGAALAAATGVLDGKNATVNNLEYEWIIREYPKVKWTKAKKWIIDGNIWTGSGAVAGMDMVAHWVKKNYGLEVLTQACLNLDFEPRDQDGLFTVLPERFDEQGNKVSTLIFP
ncbi:thij/pfpi [Penicillium canariense]|uniref:Thij/pfpi n=1 Tax=Penicillium canariense TaxID=189055 RepID=A0A9W9HXQ3_9EURO|nr:thij/pfpi [Penicillium canariense]KAJ5159733.1 thij/pfpi [Penicillium canariense]